MANSFYKYTGTGALQNLAVPPYIDRTHIFVSINNVDSTSFSWVNANTISLTAPNGSFVKVYRSTSPNARVTDYIDGVPLTEAALDNDSLQAFYLSQEQLDATQDALLVISQPNFQTIADAISANAAIAATAATSASTGATAAAGSATAAAGSATTATTQATNASNSATAAAGSATTASTQATNASNSATAAANSATAASGSATTAAGSVTAAATQATNAGNSATAAAASAVAAAASAAAAVGVPVGGVVDYFGTSAPAGFLLCPTSLTLINRSTYSALFAIVGTKFSAGDGSTTFGMPWFAPDYVAVQANGNVGSSTVGAVISHVHTQQAYDGVNGIGNGAHNILGTGENSGSSTYPTGGTANYAAGVRVAKIVRYI